MEVFFARMVMPRSRSRSLLSITRSTIRSLLRKVPVCCSSRSTSVVFPWSAWAMMATFRMSLRRRCLFMAGADCTRSLLDREARFWKKGSRLGRRGGPGPLFEQHLARRGLQEVELDDAQSGEHLLDVAVLVDVAQQQPARERLARDPPVVEDPVAPRGLGGLDPAGVEVGQQQTSGLQDAARLARHLARRFGVVVIEDIPGDHGVERSVRVRKSGR